MDRSSELKPVKTLRTTVHSQKHGFRTKSKLYTFIKHQEANEAVANKCHAFVNAFGVIGNLMKYLKQFWRDLSRLSKAKFGLKYVVPAVAIFFTYGAVGHFYVSYLTLNDLQKQTGKVLYAEVRFLQGTKQSYKYYPLYIELGNFPREFRLMDTYKDYFPSIREQVYAAGEITIYYRTPFQTFLGFGKETDIIQISNGNKTIFSMETVARHSRKTSLWMFGFGAILWLVYYIFHIRRQKKLKAAKAAYNSGLASVRLDG